MFITFILIGIGLIFLINNQKLYKNVNKSKIYFFFMIFVNFIKSLFNQKYEKELIDLYETFTRTYKSPRKWTMFFPHVYVDKPEDIQIVLNTVLEKPHAYTFAHNENGLITANGALWRAQRKLLNGSFNLRVLQSFFPIFNDKVDILVQKIGEIKESVDIAPYFNRFSLDSICATSFGWDSEVQHGKHKNYLEATSIIPEIIYKRAISPWLYPDFIYKKTKLYKEEKKHFENIYRLSNKVIEIKREEFKNSKSSDLDDGKQNINDDDSSIIYNTPQILIKQLFKLCKKNQITEKILFDHCDTMIAAATETTSSAIANIILLLAMHPEIQERVYQELLQVFPEQESYVSYDEMMKLNYLDMVIKETLRFISTVPMIPRKASCDLVLSNNFLVKKGTNILVLVSNVHKNPEIWGPNVNKFDPDHFLPEKIATRHTYSYVPFSAVPRECIGQRYSIFSMKISLAKILRKYRFTTDQKFENIKQLYGVTITLLDKHCVKPHHRVYV